MILDSRLLTLDQFPMKTDAIFYKLFQEFPDIFFELIGKPEINSNLYEFQSQEIKETSFRLDGIFLTLESLPNEPIYFVEVQCYKDKLFYDRFLTSIILYFYRAIRAEKAPKFHLWGLGAGEFIRSDMSLVI